ncbi:asparagine synthase (glutamine-hydrolyzing) [Flexithrix dorotheae]|uniref:asparagine synthase (glutamine-hydrolyzing) n=1 Tax=Flexithrix dorotheae TaxID=70993 RepID=UPI00037B4DBA|nr:asparagine synthase (glutamine-hydrolyzing) [Flexithrix dorotheae]
MCGIAGFLSMDYSRENLQTFTTSLKHRGPDAEGLYFNEKDGIGLGHQRLSILDLSEGANQPFESSCGRYLIVYNGEVYNFQELKNQVLAFKNQKKPFQTPESQNQENSEEIAVGDELEFKTSCDTEVIIESFALWGPSMVSRLNGMFAIAIYDKEEKKLYLFRDRLGIKPLYYFQEGNNFIFSSELKGFKKILPKGALTLNKQAIGDFLHLGYIPGNHSIYEKINKFPAGHFAIIESGDIKLLPFWEPDTKIANKVFSEEDKAKKNLKSILESAVEKRMVSDVPLGTFLSGGIDSSTVTAIAQNLSSQPIKTFSIGFKEAKFNESQYAKEVAKALKTDHHEFILSEDEAILQVENLLNIYDQPFADSSAIPTLLVSEMAKKHVSVALSGDGGDELFMGYGMYNWAKRLDNPMLKSFRPIIHTYLKYSGSQRNKRASSLFDFNSNTDLKSHIFSQEQYLFSHKELTNNLLTDKYKNEKRFKAKFEISGRILDIQEEQAFYDLKNYLKDDLLVKVDMASMHHSLEVRVPLLDHRIVEFALNLDSQLKVKKGSSKYLLKEVLYSYLPKSLFDRPKWGFSIPMGSWLKNQLLYLIEKYLDKNVVVQFGIVRPEAVEKLKEDFFNGADFLYNRIWALIILHKWLMENDEI